MKKYLFGLFALTFAIALVSFTTKVKTTKLWVFDDTIGNPASVSDAQNQLKYFEAVSEEPCEGVANKVCTILADEDPNNLGYPLIDASLQSDIATALHPSGATVATVSERAF